MSTEKEYDIDLDVLSGFIDESQDELLAATDAFIALQQQGFDENLIQRVFRVFHSIKGNAAYFSLFAVKDFSHKLEQLLDKLRKKELPVTDQLINLLISSTGSLQEAFTTIQHDGVQAAMPADFANSVAEMETFLNAGNNTLTPGLASQILSELKDVQSNKKSLDALIEKYESLQQATQDKTGVAETQNVPAESSEKYWDTIEVAQKLFELLQTAGDTVLDEQAAQESLQAMKALGVFNEDLEFQDELRTLCDKLELVLSTVGLDPLMRELFLDDIKNLLQKFPPDVKGQQDSDKPVSERPGSDKPVSDKPAVSQSSPGKTIRISEKSVDVFLEYVGELIIVKELYTNLTSAVTMANFDPKEHQRQLKKATEMFAELSRSLQKSIMEIRKVPISQLFKRMPKIVHDIASKTEKKIKLTVHNDSLLVDKAIVEKLESPLVHMIRNAADHGIEPQDKRVELGKDPSGNIVLDAKIKKDIVEIELSDDGAGINMEAMRNKAIELGLISPQAEFTEKHCIDVMFHSGVSTASAVTDISGRGVGMDVVKKTLDDAGGKITTKTKPGKGTSFFIQMPLEATTQIMTGFVINSGHHRLVIPIDKVKSTIQKKNVRIQSASDKEYYFKLNERIVPLHILEDIISSGSKSSVDAYDIILILSAGDKDTGFLIDRLEGIKQLVMKDISLPDEHLHCFTGGAVMADGSVSLVINPEDLIFQATGLQSSGFLPHKQESQLQKQEE